MTDLAQVEPALLVGDEINPEVAFLLGKDTNAFRDTLQALMAHGEEWIDRLGEMLRDAAVADRPSTSAGALVASMQGHTQKLMLVDDETVQKEIFISRLSQAIVEVCGDASPADLAGQNKVRSCRADAHQRLATERDQRIASASSRPIQVAAR